MRLFRLLAFLPAVLLAAGVQAKSPPPSAVQTMRRGVRAYEEARFDEALELLSQALEAYPGWKTATSFRAIVLWTTGDVAAAQADAKLGLALNPDNAESFAARGFSRFVLKHLDLAAKDFVRAAKLDPQCALAYFGMGSVRSSQKKLPDALTNLNIAIKLHPHAAAAYIVRGTVHSKMGRYGKAASDFSQVISLAPSFHWAYYYRGRAYRDLKDYDKAVNDLTKFLGHFPDSQDALYFRSNAYFLTGNYRGAVQDLDRLLTLNPKHALARANRGMARGALGDREGALADLRAAKEADPGRADKLQEQIDRIQAEAVTGASAPKTEITGTPGKGFDPGAEPGAQGAAGSEPPSPPRRPSEVREPGQAPPADKETISADKEPASSDREADHPAPALRPEERPRAKKGTPPARLPIDGTSESEAPETSGDVLFIK